MSTLTQGAIVVIPNLLDMWPDYDDPDSQPVRINALGIVADEPNEGGHYEVKYVASEGKIRGCMMGPDDEVVVLTHGVEGLVGLLPEIIADLVAASHSTHMTPSTA